MFLWRNLCACDTKDFRRNVHGWSASCVFVVMNDIKVYGGGVSVVYGSYTWSSTSFNGRSACSAGFTNVSDISFALVHGRFVNCSGVTSAVQGEKMRSAAQGFVQYMLKPDSGSNTSALISSFGSDVSCHVLI
jgi:hypothetical protein